MRRIDSLFSCGGLRHSPRRRTSPAPPAQSTHPARKRKQKPHPSEGPTETVLRVPEWNSFPWLLHGFSTRRGGVSRIYGDGHCGELNLGFTPDDSRDNVLENRKIFLQAVAGGRAGREQPELALLRQIHSGMIHRLAPATQPQRGDGWITDEPGTWIGVLTADCVPVLVADTRMRIVAAFHAGWRGTLARIAERGVGRMRAEFGCRPEDLTAAIGPGIGPCCYSVGEEVRMEFESQFSYANELFQEVFDLDPIKQKYPMLFLTARAPGHSNLGPSTHLNLPEANRRQLQDAGIRPDRIYSVGSCTACNTSQFFSHRAQHGFTGRMMSVIGLAG